MSRFNLDTEARALLNPASAAVGCVAIWALAFAMIAPVAFSLTVGPYYFNIVGRYSVINGRCKKIERDTTDGLYSGLYLYNAAIFVPLVFILVSYIFISAVLEVEKRRKQRILDTQTQVPVRQIQVTLVALSAAVLIFSLPFAIVPNITFEDRNTEWTAIEVSWGWSYWMFAVNFILYVTTLKDFRMMFKQVLKEFIYCLSVITSRKDTLDELPISKC